MTKIKRDNNLNPRFVRIVGRAGEPGYGLVASRKHPSGTIDVITVRPLGPALPERTTIPQAHTRPADLLTEPVETFMGIIDKLVESGSITRAERRSLWAARRARLKPTFYKCKGVTKDSRARKAPGARPWANIGAGALGKDWRRANGFWG